VSRAIKIGDLLRIVHMSLAHSWRQENLRPAWLYRGLRENSGESVLFFVADVNGENRQGYVGLT